VGETLVILNLDKKEALLSISLGKFGEAMAGDELAHKVLVWLLTKVTPAECRGFGWGNIDLSKFKYLGRWAGDRVVIVGEYNPEINFDEFEDITVEVLKEMLEYAKNSGLTVLADAILRELELIEIGRRVAEGQKPEEVVKEPSDEVLADVLFMVMYELAKEGKTSATLYADGVWVRVCEKLRELGYITPTYEDFADRVTRLAMERRLMPYIEFSPHKAFYVPEEVHSHKWEVYLSWRGIDKNKVVELLKPHYMKLLQKYGLSKAEAKVEKKEPWQVYVVKWFLDHVERRKNNITCFASITWGDLKRLASELRTRYPEQFADMSNIEIYEKIYEEIMRSTGATSLTDRSYTEKRIELEKMLKEHGIDDYLRFEITLSPLMLKYKASRVYKVDDVDKVPDTECVGAVKKDEQYFTKLLPYL